MPNENEPRQAWGWWVPRPRGARHSVFAGEVLAQGSDHLRPNAAMGPARRGPCLKPRSAGLGIRVSAGSPISARTPVFYLRAKTASRLPDIRLMANKICLVARCGSLIDDIWNRLVTEKDDQ